MIVCKSTVNGSILQCCESYANRLYNLHQWHQLTTVFACDAPCGAGTPLFPLVHLLHLFPFLLFPFLPIFFFLSIPSLSTRIVPLRFQVGGRRRRPNLGLVVLFFNLCYLYSLVKIWIVVFCSILFSFMLCVFLQCFDTVGWVI